MIDAAHAGGMTDNLVPLRKVSERTGIPVATLKRYCSAGVVKAQKPGSEWLVLESEVRRLEQQRSTGKPIGGSRGRPRGSFKWLAAVGKGTTAKHPATPEGEKG